MPSPALLIFNQYSSISLHQNYCINQEQRQENGRAIFSSVTSLKPFFMISRLLRFGQRKTIAARKKHDKLAAIRKV
ncbi:hypothetical protein T06_12508 [Trichinella sp. T6]|nr:hypothetical protein T06_12508 [Trichinella sp. T6]